MVTDGEERATRRGAVVTMRRSMMCSGGIDTGDSILSSCHDSEVYILGITDTRPRRRFLGLTSAPFVTAMLNKLNAAGEWQLNSREKDHRHRSRRWRADGSTTPSGDKSVERPEAETAAKSWGKAGKPPRILG